MTIRRRWTQLLVAQPVLATLICLELAALSVSSEDLFVRRSLNDIRVIAPHLHFLTGKALERLHDGAVVPFDFQLSIAAGSKNNFVVRAAERFSISYDVWQQKFSVVRLRDFRKSSMSLTANGAEAWCVENVMAPVSALPPGKDLWARLEIRSVEPRDRNPSGSDTGISIATLIETLSRPPRPQQDRWSLESAAFHLTDLKP